MKHLLFAIITIGITITSCEKEVFIDLEHQSKPIFNCILNPDSLISAELIVSKGINDNNQFKTIDNAEIKIFENDTLLGTLTQENSDSYIFPYYPKEGKTYRVEIVTETYPVATAETKVPERTYIQLKKKESEPDKYGGYLAEIIINDPIGENFYWYYSYTINKAHNTKYVSSYYTIYCPYFDDFNKEIEPEIEPGYLYNYMVRIKDEQNDGGIISWETYVRSKDYRFVFDNILEADKHYDKYLKTSVQMRMQESQTIQLNEPVPIYSNVKNGYGIFGANVLFSFKY